MNCLTYTRHLSTRYGACQLGALEQLLLALKSQMANVLAAVHKRDAEVIAVEFMLVEMNQTNSTNKLITLT